jgi:hypothetical protein
MEQELNLAAAADQPTCRLLEENAGIWVNS